jgi:hypothetical protein
MYERRRFLRTERKTKTPRVPPIPRETAEIADRRELLLCGVTGIEEYCPCRVRIRTSRGSICVSGCSITLCWAGERRLLLKGELEGIEFLKK